MQDIIVTLTVIFMFVVRIGIPLAGTLVIGYWLEKKLRMPESAEQAQPERIQVVRSGKSGNIIHLHCWDVKRCEQARRAQCAAHKHPELPCWLALQVEGDKINEACFVCALYKPQTMAA